MRADIWRCVLDNSEDLRLLSLETLLEYERTGTKAGEIIDAVLEKYAFLPKSSRAFYARLTEGTIEQKILLDYIIDCYSSIPVRRMKPVIRNILRMSVYQIREMNSVPDRAALSEALRLAQKKGFRNLKGFVNGVLRSVIRYPKKADLELIADDTKRLSVKYSMPEFLVREFAERFGIAEAEKIFSAFEKKNKTTIRIRGDEEKRQEALRLLENDGITVEKAPFFEYAYYISNYDNIVLLDAFRNGSIVVQDISSMLAIEAAGIHGKKMRVLDMCAAPGGKSMLASDLLSGESDILSCDVSIIKTRLIDENIGRCHINNIETLERNAEEHNEEFDDCFDLVIADVPCSGYGVIGHKPDIKYNSSKAKQHGLSIIQKGIIDNAVKYVKPGGLLIYSTCTISIEENEENAAYILKKRNFEAVDISKNLPSECTSETAKGGYIQLIPGRHPCDGFFTAVFKRNKNNERT